MAEQHQMIWLTVLLVLFAAAQALFTWWGGNIQRRAAEAEADRRLKERNAEQIELRRRRERDWDIARRLATTETMRISLLVARFNQAEAPEFGLAVGLFEPREFRVADPAEFARNMALVGPAAGDLASLVITVADDFAAQVEGLARMVQAAASAKGIERIREIDTVTPHTKAIVLRLRTAGEELKALIDDAAQQCLPEDPGRRRFKGTPKSNWAKMYKQSWDQRSVKAPSKPNDGE